MVVLWQRIKARLLFMGIGLALGLLVATIVGVSYTTRLKELEGIRKEQLLEKTQLIKSLETKYSKLETENKKIKSHVHVVERTNADGSTEKIYDSKRSVESERTVVEQQVTIEKLSQQRKIDLLNYQWEKKLIKESKPVANLSIGIDSNYNKFIHVNYTIYGPVTFGILGTQTGTYGLTLGVSL